jgi:hypothetical protein
MITLTNDIHNSNLQITLQRLVVDKYETFMEALRVRGRKQGQCRPQLGGRHLHGSPEGLRNLLMAKYLLGYASGPRTDVSNSSLTAELKPPNSMVFSHALAQITHKAATVTVVKATSTNESGRGVFHHRWRRVS